MALSTLTYEVPRARRWNTFVAGLAIDLIGLLVLIALGSRLGGQVFLTGADPELLDFLGERTLGHGQILFSTVRLGREQAPGISGRISNAWRQLAGPRLGADYLGKILGFAAGAVNAEGLGRRFGPKDRAESLANNRIPGTGSIILRDSGSATRRAAVRQRSQR